MPLAEICRTYAGRLLYIRPFYGWGWTRLDEGAPAYSQEERAGPAPFHLHLCRFNTQDDVLEGAQGIVEEPGHPCHGLHAVFDTRHAMLYDFTENISAYNIQLGSCEPVESARSEAEDGWTLWEFAGNPWIVGYCWIGDSEATVERWHQRWLDSAETTR